MTKFLRYLIFVYKTTLKIWPKYAIVITIKSVTEVLDVFLYSYGTAKLIQVVFDASHNGNTALPAAIWLSALITTKLLNGVMTNLLYTYSNVFAEKTRTYLTARVAKTLNTIPYAYFEDKQFQTDLKTLETIAIPKFINSTDYLPNFAKSVLVFLAGVGIFIFKYPAALLVILGVLLEILTVRPYVLEYNKQRDKIAGLSRYVDYFMQQILGLANYRLNKVYSLYEYLGHKLKEYSQQLQQTLFTLNKKISKGRILSGSLGSLVGRFIPWGYYTFAAISRKITPEQYVFILSFTSSVYNKTFLVMRLALELMSASDYYDILEMFVENKYPPERLIKAGAIREISRVGKGEQISGLESIEIKKIWFRYPDSEKWILQDLSLEVSQGKPVLITGPNGIGKTTLFYIIYGLFKPQKGKIIINRTYDLDTLNIVEYQKHISYVLQENPRLYLELRDNVALQELKRLKSSKLHKEPNKPSNETIAKLKQALKLATLNELVELVDKNPSQILGKFFAEGKELSGGQWRKLAISRLFYADTSMWLLDEPFVNIDTSARKEILQNLITQAVKCKKILVIVSHLPEVKKTFLERKRDGFRVLTLK